MKIIWEKGDGEFPKSCSQCPHGHRAIHFGYCTAFGTKTAAPEKMDWELFSVARADFCPLMELKENEKLGKFIFVGKGKVVFNKEMMID
jgi:hypothetical protein